MGDKGDVLSSCCYCYFHHLNEPFLAFSQDHLSYLRNSTTITYSWLHYEINPPLEIQVDCILVEQLYGANTYKKRLLVGLINNATL